MNPQMRIGVMGDTHGDVFSIRQAVTQAGKIDLWLHTGDFFRDSFFLGEISGVPVVAVSGNCDSRIQAVPDEFLELSGIRFWLTHGHHYGVKQDLNELAEWARRYEADVVVFGHTHQPLVMDHDGVLLFNPGSTIRPHRKKNRSYGILELSSEERKINPQLYSIL